MNIATGIVKAAHAKLRDTIADTYTKKPQKKSTNAKNIKRKRLTRPLLHDITQIVKQHRCVPLKLCFYKNNFMKEVNCPDSPRNQNAV